MHRPQEKMIVFIISICILSGQDLYAAGNFFTGSCTSQKNWVFAAREQMSRIQHAIESLKEDRDCKGIATVIPALTASLPEANSSSFLENSARLIRESKDLRHMYEEGNEGFQTAVRSILSQKILEQEKEKRTAVPLNFDFPHAGSSANSVNNLARRSTMVMDSALDGVSQFLNVLPDYRSCFSEKPEAAGIIFSGILNMLGSFVGQGQGTLTKLSTVSNQYFSVFERNDFFGILRAGMERRSYDSAMSCLVESTTTNYCSGNDANNLLKYQTKLEKENLVRSSLDVSQSKMRGYYILTKELPKVSTWLQRVLNGSPPQMTSQAEFLNSVIKSVANLQSDRLSILGKVAEQTKFYSGDYKNDPNNTLSAKRTYVLAMLKDVVGQMYYANVREGGVNFFSITLPDRIAPFSLLGTELPDELRETAIATKAWYAWITDNLDTYAPMSDPDLALATITKNLEILLDRVMITGSKYFSTWFIPDPTMVVDEALATSTPPTVYMSFVNIVEYLIHLMTNVEPKLQEARIKAVAKNAVLLEKITELQVLYEESGKKPEDIEGQIIRMQMKFSRNEQIISFASQPSIIASIDDTKNKILEVVTAFQLRNHLAKEMLSKSELERFEGPYKMKYFDLPESVLEVLQSDAYRDKLLGTRDKIMENISESKDLEEKYTELLLLEQEQASEDEIAVKKDMQVGSQGLDFGNLGELLEDKGLAEKPDQNSAEIFQTLLEDGAAKGSELDPDAAQPSEGDVFTIKVVADVMAGKIKKDSLREIDKAIMQLAFEKFNVIIQRDTFLSNRILNYVRYEFLVNGILDENTPDYMRELLVASGTNLVEQITALTQQNPQLVHLDLGEAQRMNSTSLEMVGNLAVEPFVEMICRLTGELGISSDVGVSALNMAGCLKMSKNVTPLNKTAVNFCEKTHGSDDTKHRSCVKEYFDKEMKNSNHYLTLLGFDTEYLSGRSRGSDELQYANQQSVFREKELLRAKYCIQSLGFISQFTLFADICDGVILKSQLSELAKYDQISTDANFDNLFGVSVENVGNKTREQADENRICAFRDHLRKNHVYFMVNSSR